MPISSPTSTSTTTTPSLYLKDVGPDDYFYSPVEYLLLHGAISGYNDQTFRPFNNATRGQVAKIVITASGFPLAESKSATFTDVLSDSPFFSYIETAAAHELINGYSCGEGCLEFRPFAPVTRGQLAKIIVAAEGWAVISPAIPTFSDVVLSNPFFDAIETAYAHGIISGYDVPNGQREFRWGDSATRGQIAKIVYGAVSQH